MAQEEQHSLSLGVCVETDSVSLPEFVKFCYICTIYIKHFIMALHIIDHPLVQHKLSIMRNKETSTSQFRKLLKEIAMFMGYEITRDFPLTYEEIETPLQKMNAPKIAGKKVVIAPILRAGLGMVDGLTELMPSARIGHIGM